MAREMEGYLSGSECVKGEQQSCWMKSLETAYLPLLYIVCLFCLFFSSNVSVEKSVR